MPKDSPDCFQTEVTDLQSEMEVGRAYNSNDLVTSKKIIRVESIQV